MLLLKAMLEATDPSCADVAVQVLSASQGNILEDEGAITVVSDAKALGTDIAEKQRAADETRTQIEEARRSASPLHSRVLQMSDLITIEMRILLAFRWSHSVALLSLVWSFYAAVVIVWSRVSHVLSIRPSGPILSPIPI